MPTYLTFALMLPICGVASMTLMTAANAFVQMAVGDDMRGRVMALYMPSSWAARRSGPRCSAGWPSTSAPAGP